MKNKTNLELLLDNHCGLCNGAMKQQPTNQLTTRSIEVNAIDCVNLASQFVHFRTNTFCIDIKLRIPLLLGKQNTTALL